MSRPRLLDLFCGDGGCSVEPAAVVSDVVGVDNEVKRNYPYEFVHGDALEYLERHGSRPQFPNIDKAKLARLTDQFDRMTKDRG